MKKLSVFVLVFAVVLTIFTACSSKNEAPRPTTSTTKMGEVATSYINQSAEGKTVVYETDKKQTLKLDICDAEGNLKYTEEYLYDQYGAVYGYSYYNKDGVFVASYLFAGEKSGYFYKDGTPMPENEFAQKMNAIGAAGD